MLLCWFVSQKVVSLNSAVYYLYISLVNEWCLHEGRVHKHTTYNNNKGCFSESRFNLGALAAHHYA